MKDVEKLTYGYVSHENKVIWASWKTVLDFLLKSLKTEKMYVSHTLDFECWSSFPKEVKTHVLRKVCARAFMSILCLTAYMKNHLLCFHVTEVK